MRSVLRIVGSLKAAAVVLVLLAVAMACATVYEAMHGTPAALDVFYKSRWFEALLWLLAINVLSSVLSRYPWSRRHIGFVITHASILLILAGAEVTNVWGVNGQVGIVEGKSASEFAIKDAGQLTLQKVGDREVRRVDLGGGVGGVFPVDRPAAGTIVAGDVRVEVETYIPDGQASEMVLNDNPQPRLALQVRLSGAGQDSMVWVFAGEKPGPDDVPVALQDASEAAEMDRWLKVPASQPAGGRTLKVAVKDASFELPFEPCQAGPVPVGQTGYTVRVLRYMPHARVDENKQLVNASDRPVNPAVEVEIAGPAGTSKRVAFAKFPEFASMRGAQDPAGDVKLTFVDAAVDRVATAIEMMAGPDGRLAVRFSPENGPAVSRELPFGTAVETPWPGLQFAVLQRFERARREPIVEPVDPPRENRQPAVQVSVRQGVQARQIWLLKNTSRRVTLKEAQYEVGYDDKIMPLGYEIRLSRFQVGRYPGSMQPRSFESHVTFVEPNGVEQSRVISMNHPAKFGAYSLFQSNYEMPPDGPATSVLGVSWDPGQPLVFIGYISLIVGMLYVLAIRVGQRGMGPEEEAVARRQKIASLTAATLVQVSKSSCLILVMTGVLAIAESSWAQSAMQPPEGLDLGIIRAIPVQHDGRWMPLDTLARDEVETITGRKSCRGQDPVAWLLAWTFQPEAWANEPLIAIASAELRGELQLPADRTSFSFNELVQHEPLRVLIEQVSQRAGGKMNPFESKVSDIHHKLTELQEVFANEVIRPIPDAADRMAAWKPIELPGKQDGGDAATPVEAAWRDLRSAFTSSDAAAFASASQRLADELAGLTAAFRPGADRLATELRYNDLHPYAIAWKIMLLGVLLSAVAVGVGRRWMDAIAVIPLLAGFGVLSYGMYLRWQIAGRIPASNMFESLLFMSWGAGAFAIVALLVMRDRLVPLTASFIGALSLLLADVLPIDHFVRPIAPVLLDTVWMSIHVPGIMISYAVLALAMLIAHAQIVAMAVAPRNRLLINKLDSLHYWYVHVGTILLGAGIITGSMWAASSWGRYWGWDPKEVWSLVAFLAYLVILHVRRDYEPTPGWVYAIGLVLAAALFVIVVPKLGPLSALKVLALVGALAAAVMFVAVRGRFAAAVKSAVAFWFIIMTYVGVNYVLGIGLHSYGFGTGAVVKYMMLTGGVDLGLVALLTAVYLVRTSDARPGVPRP